MNKPVKSHMNTRTISSRLSRFETAVRTATLIALCVAAPLAAIAQAASGAPQTASARVSLAGLDLATPEGQKTARERLHEMARIVCSRVADRLDLSHQPNFVKCLDDTLANAMQQLKKDPSLAATQRSGTVPGIPANTALHPVDVVQTSTSKVSLADLDLATPEGTRAAYERLHAAARLACSRVEDSLDLGHQPQFVACVDAAMASALPQVQELARKGAPGHVARNPGP
jgi:UrcA family protein